MIDHDEQRQFVRVLQDKGPIRHMTVLNFLQKNKFYDLYDVTKHLFLQPIGLGPICGPPRAPNFKLRIQAQIPRK